MVFLIPAVSAVATAFPTDFRKHLGPGEFFLVASLVVLQFLILVIAVLWLSVRLCRTIDESRRVTTTGSVASVPRAALELSVPARIPAGDQPVTLTITSLLSVLPLNIDVNLPPELRFHPGDQSGRKRTVTLSPGDVVGLPVVNSRQNLISSSPSITLTVSGEQYDPVPIEVEGEWAGALRGFMDRVEAQPGLLQTLVGGGLLAQLFQWLQYRYQREQKQREEVREVENKLVKALEQGRIDEAGQALDVWKTLAPPGDAPTVVAATRRLLSVARAEVESGEDLLRTMQLYAKQWPDACGRALQMGYDNLSARMDMATLRIARSYIQPKDPELIRWEEDLKAREDKRSGITPDWLSPRLESEPLTAERDSAATTGNVADLRNYWRASAEDDRWYLFHRPSKNAFWRGHPLSGQLRETRDPRLNETRK